MTINYEKEKANEFDDAQNADESTDLMQKADDLTATVIGDFGRWQLWISIMMAVLKLPIAWYQLNIIFMAPPQEFWCAKPKSLWKYSDEEWRKICAPLVEEHPCLIFDPLLLNIDPDIDKTIVPLVRCEEFVYDKTVFSRTITSDWDLVCSKHWIIHFTQCIMMWGILLGGIFFGILADKYGRKKPLMYAILIQSVTSYLASVLPWYWVFLFNWFILALASGGIGIISFVISMEVVSGKWRTIIPVIYQVPFGLGSTVMACLAYWLRDWRQLEVGLASLSSLFILYWFWLSESPRWLIATGKLEEALQVLKKAAEQNGREFDSEEVQKLLIKTKEKKKMEPNFMAFLKSKNMRMKTLLLSMNCSQSISLDSDIVPIILAIGSPLITLGPNIVYEKFCTGLAFFTFSQYLGSIGGDIFTAVAWTGIISILGGLTCIYIVTRVGRKTTVGIYQLITALCFVFILFIPKDEFANDWPRLLFAGIGFAGLAGTIPALYLFSGELFPTFGRNVGVSGVTTFARIASMIAPAVVSLDGVISGLPLTILAVTSIAQIFILWPLPETRHFSLPDTLEEAERIR